MPLVPFEEAVPDIDPTVFVSQSATIIGHVTIGELSSLWFGSVIRGDINDIRIGCHSNIQDRAVLHVSGRFPLSVGDYVSIGHSAILHGCTIGNNVLVGTGAMILDGASIGENCLIGAGAVVPENASIPPNSFVMGVPGKVHRKVTENEIAGIRGSADNHVTLVDRYLSEEDEEET